MNHLFFSEFKSLKEHIIKNKNNVKRQPASIIRRIKKVCIQIHHLMQHVIFYALQINIICIYSRKR